MKTNTIDITNTTKPTTAISSPCIICGKITKVFESENADDVVAFAKAFPGKSVVCPECKSAVLWVKSQLRKTVDFEKMDATLDD